MTSRTEANARSADAACSKRIDGFSLIEMLVALAIFALAVLGLLNLAGESTRTAVVIEERVLAGVLADNLAVDAMVVPREQLAAATAGSETVGDTAWRWTRTLAATDDPGILRVDITVLPEREARIAAELSLFRSALP
jgi:general secretion pathway protein I